MTIMITIDFISKKYNYFKNKKNIRYIHFLKFYYLNRQKKTQKIFN